ncbi:MAG TPA: hypothetical protein DHW82_09510 [Spirochaetia bacterium]|nr:hypothetical protein [Spirochaetia bacterium]
MKILFLGDIHGKTEFLSQIEEEFDLLVVTGDLTLHGDEKEIMRILESLKFFSHEFYSVSGNMDLKSCEPLLESFNLSLHGKGIYYQNQIGFFGCGGSSPTPFHTPNEYSEEEIFSFLKKGYQQIQEADVKIMVCHTPPQGTHCDRLPNGAHVGSQKVRQFIETYQPDFCLTGHIHESIGFEEIGKSLVLNPGDFQSGRYGILDTDKKDYLFY